MASMEVRRKKALLSMKNMAAWTDKSNVEIGHHA